MKFSQEIKTAILIIGCLGTFIFGFNYLKGTSLFDNQIELHAIYSDVEGLIPGAKVTINGYSVGKVTGINFDETYDKIKVSFSSQGARITSTQMIEKDENNLFKYKTYNDFINEINKPLSLFEKETSYMSLTIVDNEKVVPIETKDLFFRMPARFSLQSIFSLLGGKVS